MSSRGILGGLHHQYARVFGTHKERKRVLCQRTSVSGRMIVRTCRIEGNQRYSWIRNQRSWLVSRTRPGSLRLTTVGAVFGLTPSKYQSGEITRTGCDIKVRGRDG